MKRVLLPLAAALAATAGASNVDAQQLAAIPRLPLEHLAVMPPSERVHGAPGAFLVAQRSCTAAPGRNVRRHIVDVVVQEWAFFGFSVLDETNPDNWFRRRRPRQWQTNGFDAGALLEIAQARVDEAARVAASIAGYWAVTPEGPWIVDRQNEAWNASGGRAARWVEPWSAAFVSWVMCEAGFTENGAFRRAIAHHAYIDQAIRARDGQAPEAAYVAYDVGEAAILPGDLLCAARRPAYRTLEDRRAQMGVGARTHCDVIVKVDEERGMLLAIGGNVRGTVGLKLLPAERRGDAPLRPLERSRVAPGARSEFAHLKLQADPIEPSAFDTSPTIAALACSQEAEPPMHLIAANVLRPDTLADRC